MEFVRSEVEIKVYGEALKMRLPTYKETIQYRIDIKECGEDEEKQTHCLFSFLGKLGMPESVCDKLEIHHMSQVIDLILKKTK